jgi:hypothetical protein
MAESPPPAAGAQSCSEERWQEEPRGARDREDEAGQSESGSPAAAPFFLLYPGDGGAGFAVRPPPQPQRAWRTPSSPGSPLPFPLLSYPSSGKHREWRGWGLKRASGQGRPGPRGAPPPAGSLSRPRREPGTAGLFTSGVPRPRVGSCRPSLSPRPRPSSCRRPPTCPSVERPGRRGGARSPG